MSSQGEYFPTVEAGFTLMEIMIATAILVVGLLGILAVFPLAIDTGRQSMEDTNAVLIAQSVEQALREGITHRKGQSKDGKWTYFLFQHEGVLDQVPSDYSSVRTNADYYILFPDPNTAQQQRTSNRNSTEESAKVFLYPEDDGVDSWEHWNGVIVRDDTVESDVRTIDGTDGSGEPNGGGNAGLADNDGDDATVSGDGYERETFRVRRVYQLGATPWARMVDAGEPDPSAISDPLHKYSFAFSLQRCRHDASLGRETIDSPAVRPAGELYECRIMIFRSFVPPSIDDEEAFFDPIYEAKVYLHK
ncbi:MAG: prepilin-type N-terminal cleavage/methylation domain-containing protein [Planctomycetota bacterium]